MNELDEVTLAACRRGQPEAFRGLVRCYQDRVFALCHALAGPDAEDIAQETFLRVHRSLRDFRPDGPARLGTWILRIARHLCTDRARGARLRVEVRQQDADAPAAGSPEAELTGRRTDERVRGAVAALPEDQRAVVVLRAWAGLEYDEIAELEGVPVGTVRSRLSRAREALKASLADLLEEGSHAVT